MITESRLQGLEFDISLNYFLREKDYNTEAKQSFASLAIQHTHTHIAHSTHQEKEAT